jgi:hypothetical protein
MSAKEYNMWLADYRIRPWGDDLADLRVGMVTQSIRARDSKKAIYMKDCIPMFEEQSEPQDMLKVSKLLRARTKAMRGKNL